MRLCAVVPSYRHVSQLPRLSRRLVELCDHVLIVDDGNTEPVRSEIAALHDPSNGVQVLRLDVNAGKGVAVLTGFREAIAQGFTHALQIDADGQHDIEDVHRFIEASRQRPEALICGQAVYDESVPRARKIGRWITHVWVWIETASLAIADSMCGFRLYPLPKVAEVIAGTRIGSRMDFDTEMAVHMHWRGTPVVNLPTKVIYPPDNVSNFEMLADNVRISKMHTRLALQAPFRLIRKLWVSVFAR
ncbi:glycosyltransferase family 2 protein [Brevundimonas sp. M20]|uniref:glycosyltransferase family 2 protein n=1 Tax=Brevundimonas sp. M20 TaxID=2591463 RepID=UPI0011474D70|nr:glycosyltransferase family 2 protein [Brevundimonas sp. M20]QDH74014.1 glycosyltransferase family 2 protein [Brevundimonas sp. M20]